MATQIVELTGDEAALLRSYDRAIRKQVELEQRLRDGGAVGDAAGTQLAAALERVERQSDQTLRTLVRELGKLGPEGAAASDALKSHLTAAGRAGYQSMESLLGKVRELDPTAAEAAESAAASIRDAANDSQAQLREMLAELSKVGPEGRTVADQLRKHMVEAGKLSEASIDDVIARINEIDPESAAAAREFATNMNEGTNAADGAFERFRGSAVEKLAGIAASYLTFQTAVGKVNEYLEEQRQLLKDIHNENLTVAGAQASALVNMVNLTEAEKREVLDVIVPRVAAEMGFSSLAHLTDAAGQAASSGAGTPEEIEAALRSSAAVSRYAVADAGPMAMGAQALANATGMDTDASTSLLMEAGGIAQVLRLNALAKTLPPTVGSVLTYSRLTDENKSRAIAQATALYGAVTEMTVDTTGKPTGTNINKLAAQMKDLTAGRQDDPGLLLGRVMLMQRDPRLRKQYLDTLQVDTAVRPFFEQLADPNSPMFQLWMKDIGAVHPGSTAKFEETERLTRTATQPLKIAHAENVMKAARQTDLLGRHDAAALQTVRNLAASTFGDTRPEGLAGWIDKATDWSDKGWLPGSTAAEEAVSLLGALVARSHQSTNPAHRARIDSSISQTLELFEQLDGPGTLDPAGVSRARAQAQQMIRSTRRETIGGDVDNGDYANVLGRMADLLQHIEETNRKMLDGEAAPAVAPALGAQAP